MSTPPVPGPDARTAPRPATDTELLSTLFELGREVTSVLDLEELLAKIPQLIARLTRFSAFSVYLLDEKRQELRIAYAVGYPEGAADTMRLQVGQGVVGAAVEEGRPILVNDIRQEPRYMGPLRNMLSQLAVPMRRKGKVIGALNLLSEAEGAFTIAGRGAAAAVRRARRRGDRERASLPSRSVSTSTRSRRWRRSAARCRRSSTSTRCSTRIASLTKRLIDYRTFGILLAQRGRPASSR